MGYWFMRSGAGKNKTHEPTAKYQKIDNFACKNFIHNGQVEFMLYDVAYRFEYEEIENNYNNKESPKRLYFLCPSCDERVRFLYYINNTFVCRVCGNLNYPIQQTAKGQRLYERQIKKILRQLKFNDDFSPFDLICVRPPRPRYMHKKEYNRLQLRLLDFQKLLNDDLTRQALKIMGADYENRV